MRHREIFLSAATFLALYLLAGNLGFGVEGGPFPFAAPGGPAAVKNVQAATAAGRREGTSPSHLAALLAVLSTEDAGLRRHAATALGKLGDVRAVGPLVEVLLRDRDAHVRQHAASALGRLGDVRAVDPLIDALLRDRDAHVREHAATSLGQLGDGRAFLPLTKAILSDKDPSVRRHAAEALGEVGG